MNGIITVVYGVEVHTWTHGHIILSSVPREAKEQRITGFAYAVCAMIGHMMEKKDENGLNDTVRNGYASTRSNRRLYMEWEESTIRHKTAIDVKDVKKSI
jgi:hypothetical protein